MTDRVLVGVASIPERVGSLEQVVASLAPQADRVAVSLNDYTEIPSFLANYPNVEAVVRPFNAGDAEKFAAVDDWDGIVATVDDDVLYPADYVARLRAGLAKYGPRTVVGFHGGTTLGWNGSPTAASHKRIRCLGTLARDDLDVNVLGTGALAYHTGAVPVWRELFRHANMADVQLACHARRMGVRFVALAHRAGWLKDICPPVGRRIYESNRDHDGTVCDTAVLRERELNRFDWVAPAPKRPRVRVSITTCARPGKLLELLQDLEREAGWVDLEVGVYEDPTGADYNEARWFCKARGWGWVRFPRPLGRREYWRLVDLEFRDTKRSPADWFLFLPDDVRLVRHAVPRALDLWDRLDDPATLTLWRLKSFEGRPSWTGVRPVQRQNATEVFHVDGLYLCRRETLELLRFRCPDTRRKKNAAMSSGVGRAVSRQLHTAGQRMYRVDRSLVLCNDGGVSVMNPEERLRQPAVAL